VVKQIRATLIALILCAPMSAFADEITLIGPGGIRAAMEKLIPLFEAKTGHRVKATFGGGGATRARVIKGEPFDIPIVQSPHGDVVKSGQVVAGSETRLADASFVVVVKRGAPKSDVTSPDGLRKMLLGARAITFPPPGATLAGDRVVEAFKKLGIAAEMEPKAKRVQGVSLEELVTRGDVDVAVTFGSEIHDPGIEVLGVLPAALIAPIPHVAFISAQTKVGEAARAFLTFISSPAAAAVYRELRMQPGSGAAAQQVTSAPAIPFDASEPLRLPDGMYLGEVAGVAVNSKGNIFVYARTASPAAIRGMRNAQLFEFDRNGKFIREIGHNLYSMAQAHAVRFDRQDNIWLVDNGSHTVVKLTPDGRPLIVLGRRPESVEAYDPPREPNPVPPAQPGIFNRPTDVAFDSAGNVYVSDGYRNSRVAKFDRDGHIVKSWGERGTKPGQFNLVHGIAIDNKDNVYVSDRSNARIQVFNAEGEFLREIPRPLPLSRTPPPIPGFGMNDRGEYNSLYPLAICINPGASQFLYAVEAIPGYIYKMTLDGKLLGTIGTAGKKIGQFAWVHAMACPSENELYVGELLNWRMQKLILRPDRATTSSR